MLISLTHEVVNNKYKEEKLIFFISSINDLCENKHSSYICNYLSNSDNFIILCGNILQLKHQYYYISCIILNICFTIFNNKYLEAMLQVLNSNKASLRNKKITYYFPFVQTLSEKQINLFKESCFYILRLLLQKEQIINYLEDYLYSITKADENINRYLEAIFYSFFYWHRKGNKRDNDNNLTYNKVKISFIQNKLLKINTPSEQHDKTTNKEIVDFFDTEDENEFLLLKQFISDKNKVNINPKKDNYCLSFLTNLISLYPNSKFIVSLLNEIPNEFILNKQTNDEIGSFDLMIETIMNKAKKCLDILINNIGNFEENNNDNIKALYKYLDMLKICLISQPISLNESFETKSKGSNSHVRSSSFQKVNAFTDKMNDVIQSLCNYIPSIFFSNTNVIKYPNTYSKIFIFNSFIIQNSSSLNLIYNSVSDNAETIIQCLIKITSHLQQENENQCYEIIKSFFLILLTPNKMTFLQDTISYKSIESLLILIEQTFKFKNIEFELVNELIGFLVLLNSNWEKTDIKELLLKFYIRSSNLSVILKILLTLNANKYQTQNLSYLTNAFISFFSNYFLQTIIKYLQSQESDSFIIKIANLIANLAKSNRLRKMNQRTVYLVVGLLKNLIIYSRIIKFCNNNIWLSELIYSIIQITEHILPYDYSEKTKGPIIYENRILNTLLYILSTLQDIYILNKPFNFQDKEIFFINDSIILHLNEKFPQDMSHLNEKLIELIIQLIIPCKIIEDNDSTNLSILKSQLLLSLWNKQGYKDLLFRLLLYIFNNERFNSLTISNITNIFLGNIGVMITNAKKQYQIFELISFRNKWIAPSFFKNKIFELYDLSVKAAILILNIIKVLEAKIKIVKIEDIQNMTSKNSRGIRMHHFQQRMRYLNPFSKILLKEDKTQICFIPQMVLSFYYIILNSNIKEDEEFIMESFDTKIKISQKQEASLILSNNVSQLKELNEINFDSKKEEILNSIPEKLSLDEEKQLKKPKQLFMVIFGKIKEISNKKIINYHAVELLNKDLSKIIYYHNFYKLLEQKDINQKVLELLHLSSSICFTHTKVGIYLKMKQLINELLLNGKTFSLMEPYFINNYRNILQHKELDNNIAKIKFEIITHYISHISNNNTFIKNNISLFNLNALLKSIKEKKFNINIISNLLDIIEHTINYLLSIHDIQTILNNDNEIKQILLVHLLNTFPLVMKIQKRILNIIKAIPHCDETNSFIQSIIDPFLSNVLMHLMNFIKDGTITDINYEDKNGYDEICNHLILIIHYYSCQSQNNEYFHTLLLSKGQRFFSQFLIFIQHFNSNIIVLEKGFYVVEKAVKEFSNLTQTFSKEIQNVLFSFLQQSVINKYITDEVVLRILTVINYIFMYNKDLLLLFHNQHSNFTLLEKIFEDFQDNVQVTYEIFKLIKILIESYLNKTVCDSESINSFIKDQFIKIMIKKNFDKFVLTARIMYQISEIIKKIINAEKFEFLSEEIFQDFLSNETNIFNSDLPSELIDIYLSTIFELCYKTNLLMAYIEPLSHLLLEISRYNNYFNDTIYKHFQLYMSVIILNCNICEELDKKKIFEYTINYLLMKIIIKYGHYINKHNLCDIISFLERAIQLNIIKEVSFIYINNILAGVFIENQRNELTKEEEQNLYEQLFQYLSHVSSYLYDDNKENINELIDLLTKIINLLWNYFQNQNLPESNQKLIIDFLKLSIEQIGLNNPLFVTYYYNRNTNQSDNNNNQFDYNNLVDDIKNIIDNLYINVDKQIILSYKDKEEIYSFLIQKQFCYYYNHEGKKNEVVIMFELYKENKYGGSLKLLTVQKKSMEIITEYLNCPIQDIEKIEKGTNSKEFASFEDKLFVKRRNPQYCFIIYLYKSYESLQNHNTISLEIIHNEKTHIRDTYINHVNKLLTAMKPLSLQN